MNKFVCPEQTTYQWKSRLMLSFWNNLHADIMIAFLKRILSGSVKIVQNLTHKLWKILVLSIKTKNNSKIRQSNFHLILSSMNKFFIYTIGIVSIIFPWLSLMFLGAAWAGLRWLSFGDLGIFWWILFIILPLICIGIQCICLRKRILRIPIMINLTLWILFVAWGAITSREVQHQNALFRESLDRYMKGITCDWWCYQDTLESFFEKKGITTIKNLDQSHLESILWSWTHDNWTRSWEKIEIVKVLSKIYYVNKHVGEDDVNRLLPLNISSNWDYIFIWMAYWTKPSEWKNKEDQENLIPNTNKRLVYITPKWLEVIDLGADSYKWDATVVDKLKWSHKFYVR